MTCPQPRASAAGAGDAAMERGLRQGMHEQAGAASSKYRGAQGLSPEVIAEIEKDFGFDKPIGERFLIMIRHYLTFNFGESYFQNRRVIDLIIDKLPVSISLGLWTTLLIYGISIPLGIAKATRDGTAFDIWTSTLIVIGYAIRDSYSRCCLSSYFPAAAFYRCFRFAGSSLIIGLS